MDKLVRFEKIFDSTLVIFITPLILMFGLSFTCLDNGPFGIECYDGWLTMKPLYGFIVEITSFLYSPIFYPLLPSAYLGSSICKIIRIRQNKNWEELHKNFFGLIVWGLSTCILLLMIARING
jgi:hypothetical protein